MSVSADSTPSGTIVSPASAPPSALYRRYLLGLLFVVYVVNFMDRSILATLGQAIKQDMGLSDLELGLLGGPSFALLYTVMGIPIARLAERTSRVAIISVAIAAWSLMTALCGVAGNYVQLALCRVGVGIGEAGCTPPAHSLISDYYPRERRASALAVYSLGIPIGTFLGTMAGGFLAEWINWRNAFFVVGLPGVGLAAIVWATAREVPRGFSEPIGQTHDVVPSLRDVFARLASKPSFVHLCIATSLAAFVGYGNAAFAHAYLVRNYHLGYGKAAFILAIIAGIGVALGTLAGGLISDRAGKRDGRWYAWTPAIGKVLTVPLALLAYLQDDWAMWAVLVCAGLITGSTYLGPAFAVTHNLVEPRMRASATALLFFFINLVGLGVGPVFVGILSDLFTGAAYQGDYGIDCAGRAVSQACQQASAIGLRNAIITNILLLGWAAAHYFRAARSLRDDLSS